MGRERDSDTSAFLPPKYGVLREVVRDYPSLLAGTDQLLIRLNAHRNGQEAVLEELRAYALKHFSIHDHHERGPEAVGVIISVFIEAMDSPHSHVRAAAADSLLFYLEKILEGAGPDIEKYAHVLSECFSRLSLLSGDGLLLLAANPHQVKKLGRQILDKKCGSLDIACYDELLSRCLLTTYDYWLKEEDLLTHCRDRIDFALTEKECGALEDLFYPVSHANLKELIIHVKDLKTTNVKDPRAYLEELLKLPGYMQVAGYYEDLIGLLPKTGDRERYHVLKMILLSRFLETRGLGSIHENTLREMSRTLVGIVKTENHRVREFLTESIGVLKKCFVTYPEATLYCIQAVGNEVFAQGDSNLVEWFIQNVISVGFQYPDVAGLTDEWQVRSNKNHLKNIRVWLELIENNPKWSKSLISALIINLRLGGVHINDTDLFQKDVTRVLESDIEPVYWFIKQLAQVFPVYFNEINAEGSLRDVSTALDVAAKNADPLVHFLRKYCHVESSSLIVDLIEETLTFFLTKDRSPLERFLPEDVYRQVSASGPYIDDMSTIFASLFKERGMHQVAELLGLDERDIRALVHAIPGVPQREKERACLAIKLYQLLYEKYRLSPQNIVEELRRFSTMGLPNSDALIAVLREGDTSQRLDEILKYLQLLKDIILSPERYEAVEDISRKRHIAAGIPSMYGKYSEKKFNALSLTFRLENLANILFEELTETFHYRFITRAALVRIDKCLHLFFRALRLDGIFSNRLDNMLELLTGALEEMRFSFSQYLDIFRGFSEGVQDILNTYYSGIHKTNLKNLILQLGQEKILPKYLDTHNGRNEFEFVNTVTERFLRDIVSGSFGLQQLDNFISRILRTLFEQAEGLDIRSLHLLLNYDPKKALSAVHVANKNTDDRIHLGNKGYNLVKLASLGIPVPPGFIITTEAFRCMPAISQFRPVRDHLHEGIGDQMGELEKLTGKKFGDPANPLLVSVRSGAAVSMPGMMNSFLNVGLHEAAVEGLIGQTGRPWFAWDCYRRFLQCWGMFFGIDRDIFDAIIDSFKRRYDVGVKIQFTPEQMREVAFAYRDAMKEHGVSVSDDPKTQLETAISLVFRSWNSEKAHTYREILGISEDWGTAVIVQAMVYGNLDSTSGTGVLFTRNPWGSGDRAMLWGDFTTGAQGEDVVSGLVKTLCISNEQRLIEERTSDVSLEDRFPEIYGVLLKIVKDLIYREKWGAQEIEFTFEGEKEENLYILQARDMAVTKKDSLTAFVPSAELTACYLSSGIGVGGSALSGRVVFDFYEMEKFRQEDPAVPLILIRADTVPDDIGYISAADGLLTARGGATSHAAIIAKKLGKTCIVGCSKLVVCEEEKKFRLNDRVISAGDFLSIDGRNGSVYLGSHRVEEIQFLTA
ncbi:MAG TPA: PEP/pyruvate-binding domain-containing protein [Thermodesulfovibrionales bacterium]|nr:PEP/pyruvate-binding domain-containing protein [Thermodesulfovibrionales bacterium]